jgi:hypothetical protein
MPVVIPSKPETDLTPFLVQAKQRHGRRFGHPGEWRYEKVEGGYRLYDPISDLLMLAIEPEELVEGWMTFLASHVRPRQTKGWGKLRFQILERDGFRCRICGIHRDEGVSLHVDHILPVMIAGDNHPDNLRTLCGTCNASRAGNLCLGL